MSAAWRPACCRCAYRLYQLRVGDRWLDVRVSAAAAMAAVWAPLTPLRMSTVGGGGGAAGGAHAMCQGAAGFGYLPQAGFSPQLQGRLRRSYQPRCSVGVGAEHAAGGVDRQSAAHRRDAVFQQPGATALRRQAKRLAGHELVEGGDIVDLPRSAP
jgi:hypothetical protein